MSSGKKPVAKKAVAKAPAAAAPKKTSKTAAATSAFHTQHAHLFSKAPKNFGIGRVARPKTNLSRFVKWPRYIRLQRQRSILKKRLKVPPALNQFAKALDKNQASNIFRLLAHYRPESKVEKATRLKATAEQTAKGGEPKPTTKPIFVKYGLNHVTKLIEEKKAKLVVIAHDVDPIELVVWLPALCRKMNVPYVIVKGRARLGHVVHKKSTAVLALTEVRKEDAPKLDTFVQNANLQYKDNVTDRKKWGGGVMGIKAQAVTRRRERQAAREAQKGK